MDHGTVDAGTPSRTPLLLDIARGKRSRRIRRASDLPVRNAIGEAISDCLPVRLAASWVPVIADLILSDLGAAGVNWQSRGVGIA
jgi:hypothetical protein